MLLLVGAAFQFQTLVSSSAADWLAFVRLFDESRLVHATTLDFSLFSLLAWYWIAHDARARGFAQPGAAAALGSVPVLGPILYLIIRPRAEE